jgi:hypothetical protein
MWDDSNPFLLGQKDAEATTKLPATAGNLHRVGAVHEVLSVRWCVQERARCPHCWQTLSAQAAADYIEMNAPGTKKGWQWQRNWCGTYCIVIENRVVNDNFRK